MARVLEVSQAARDAVRLAHFNGTTSGSHADLSVTQQRFVDTCLSGNLATAGAAPGYVGRTEDEANPPDSLNPEPPRVVGRTGSA